MSATVTGLFRYSELLYMSDTPITQKNKKELLNEVTLAAERALVREKKDTETQIIGKILEEETRQERQAEAEILEEELHQTSPPIQAGSPGSSTTTPILESPKSEFRLQIENILAEDLGDMYARMDLRLKVQFKMAGEEIARKIEQVIAAGKIKVRQILQWIKEWLKMIPGVNRYFLEQEAKIKTDRILGMGLGKY